MEMLSSDKWEAEEFANRRKAIESGYELHYYEYVRAYEEGNLTTKQCQEVLDIMNMYRAMNNWYKLQGEMKKSPIKLDQIRFKGFDAHSESDQFFYARYYINDLGRFEEFMSDGGIDELNTHDPMLDTYRDMLSTWGNCSDKYCLSEEDVQKILGVSS